MNENLVRRLRRLEAEHKKEWGGATEESCLIAEAADVIETLSAQNGIIRCRDCKHKPHYEGRKAIADDAEDYTCPYLSGDPWESDVPEDDFFCAYGEKEEAK